MASSTKTVTALAKLFGVSRSTLYYQRRRPEQDWSLKTHIEDVLHAHPSYGHRRIALTLRMNKKRVLRVMQLYGIKPYRRRPKRRSKRTTAITTSYENLLLRVPFPDEPNRIWVSDFTHLVFQETTLYLATILDLFTRQIVGWHVLLAHTTELVLGTLKDALRNTGATPIILHSDQGSEYTSKRYTSTVEEHRIRISMSRRACPWENGYQESFYSQFKLDLGHPERFDELGQLIAAIAEHISTYNTTRIHTSLKMPPAVFARRHEEKVEIGAR